jgi:putative endonuclease
MAAEHLEQAGLRILARNWRCTGQGLPGEIDLVAEEIAPDFVHGGMPVPWRVIVEVRTRRGESFGTALQSVTESKARRLRALGAAWVQEHNWHGPWRIDVVAIQMDRQGRLLSIEHIAHAVAGE